MAGAVTLSSTFHDSGSTYADAHRSKNSSMVDTNNNRSVVRHPICRHAVTEESGLVIRTESSHSQGDVTMSVFVQRWGFVTN